MQRTDHGKVVEQKLLGKAPLDHVAEAERTKRAAERRFEDVAVRIVVETAAQVLGCLTGEDAGSRVDVDGCQFRADRRIDGQFAGRRVVNNGCLAVALLTLWLNCRVRAG